MTNTAPILVATDLGEWGDLALREGHRWAVERGAPLIVLHCVPTPVPLVEPWVVISVDDHAALDALVSTARAHVLESVRALTGRAPQEVEVLIRTAAPHVEAVRAAEERQAQLVVLGARGSSGLARLLLGHSAEKVARAAHCPVLVVRPGTRTDHVLVATDLSPTSDRAVEAAARVAGLRHARLTALHVVDTGLPFPVGMGATPLDAPTHARLRDEAREALRTRLVDLEVDAEACIADGLVMPSLAQAARTLAPDLVVVGTVGRTGLSRMLLGNTAEAAIRELPCSVLVVRA